MPQVSGPHSRDHVNPLETRIYYQYQGHVHNIMLCPQYPSHIPKMFSSRFQDQGHGNYPGHGLRTKAMLAVSRQCLSTTPCIQTKPQVPRSCPTPFVFWYPCHVPSTQPISQVPRPCPQFLDHVLSTQTTHFAPRSHFQHQVNAPSTQLCPQFSDFVRSTQAMPSQGMSSAPRAHSHNPSHTPSARPHLQYPDHTLGINVKPPPVSMA